MQQWSSLQSFSSMSYASSRCAVHPHRGRHPMRAFNKGIAEAAGARPLVSTGRLLCLTRYLCGAICLDLYLKPMSLGASSHLEHIGFLSIPAITKQSSQKYEPQPRQTLQMSPSSNGHPQPWQTSRIEVRVSLRGDHFWPSRSHRPATTALMIIRPLVFSALIFALCA